MDSIPESEWIPGDIITRSGSDEQKIISIDHDWAILEVIVIKPDSGDEDGNNVCFKVGDKESNLIGRYAFVRREA